MNYEPYIGVTPDFPKKGISFKDISPLVANPEAFASCIADLKKLAEPYHPDFIVGADSRGFLFGTPLAMAFGVGFVMARKKGKLPGEVLTAEYNLEYGTGILQIPAHAIPKGARVIMIDDLIATGGTFKAMEDLIRMAGATPVLALAIIRLEELHGEDLLSVPTKTLLTLSDSH